MANQLDLYSTVMNMQYLLYHKCHDLHKVCELYEDDAIFAIHRPLGGPVCVKGRDKIEQWWRAYCKGDILFESSIIESMHVMRLSDNMYSTTGLVSRLVSADSTDRERVLKTDVFELNDSAKIAMHEITVCPTP